MRPYQRRIAHWAATRLRRIQESLLTPWPHLQVDPTNYGPVHVIQHPGDPPNEVRIGRYCSIAPGVEFLIGGNHHPEWASTFAFRAVHQLPGAYEDGQPASKGPIVVGNDVWIGRNAVILSGVTLGDGAIIGAQAVVARDVRPYAIVVGNPAREIRRRFTDDEVEALAALAWWDWPVAELHDVVGLLNGAPVRELIEYGNRRAGSLARSSTNS